MSGLSLFELEDTIVRLQDAAEDAEATDEARAAAANEIIEYCRAELLPAKVDHIRGYIRHCEVMLAAHKDEMNRQAQSHKMWAGRLDRLKAATSYAMEEFGKKKLEGKTGSLLLKGNGGLNPLTITDPSMVPDDLMDVSLTMPLMFWHKLSEWATEGFKRDTLDSDIASNLKAFSKQPNNLAIRQRLKAPCEACGGLQIQESPEVPGTVVKCTECDGTGTAYVPGARLEPRGSHLEVK